MGSELSDCLLRAKELLDTLKEKQLTIEERRNVALELAALLVEEARLIQTPDEVIHQALLARMMEDPQGKAFTTAVTDQCFRSNDSVRTADQLHYNLKKYGIPKFLSPDQKAGLFGFRFLGKLLPKIFIPLTRKIIRKATHKVILPGETERLFKHIHARKKEHVRLNLNHIGEVILGEEEAQKRLNLYLQDLEHAEIDYISIKISSIYSQINLLSRKETLDVLKDRLRQLFRQAIRYPCKLKGGLEVPKFINLDMEEYKDVYLTVELFKSVLDEQEFLNYSAGIVLQSYLPDSFAIQKDLTSWALKRVAGGGSPIKLRIVKGANLAMEQVEASLRGWPQAPFPAKYLVDANFKKMLTFACHKEHAQAVRIGVASHNLFDIAYAMVLSKENEVAAYVGFEMLEGMAESMQRSVNDLAHNMLLYCPVANEDELQYAIAYLIRRLDENTAADNFLRHSFHMIPGSKDWQSQAALFSQSCAHIESIEEQPRRTQNRNHPPLPGKEPLIFDNEPDTDWSLIHNSEWGLSILAEGQSKVWPDIPLVIGGEEVSGKQGLKIAFDPSVPNKTLFNYAQADLQQIEEAVTTAQKAFEQWSVSDVKERTKILSKVANLLRAKRRDLIQVMVANTAKTVFEADAEVSEAIDFAEYYQKNLEELYGLEDIQWKPKGVVVVTPPWNFPCSIPAGSIIGPLAAGDTVIFKPAPEAILVGYELAKIFWEASVPKDVLQFIACEDEPAGTSLIKDPRVSMVVLTGATQTAHLFLNLRPGIDLIAETGGKNAMIVTAMADRDLAVKDIVQSAFGYAGQKCSACSLVICEAEVYEDPKFRSTLKDAAASLAAGSPWDAETKLNPLIRAPNPQLMRALTTLEPGEEWLLTPIQDSRYPHLWSPGIKLGVQPGGFTHQTELFGPVLGVMRADNLKHAIELANSTVYGLTSGLHSLDEREQEIWQNSIEAGNLYINRGITGAIVQRQPFGGIKASSFGSGHKAGGPNYVMQFMIPTQKTLPTQLENTGSLLNGLNKYVETLNWGPEEMALWHASLGSYLFYWKHYFSQDHDPSKLIGQDNIFKYKPRDVTVRLSEGDSLFDVLRVLAISQIVNNDLEISLSPEHPANQIRDAEWMKEFKNVSFFIENEYQFIERLKQHPYRRIRTFSTTKEDFNKALAAIAQYVLPKPILANGRLELLNSLQELSLSNDYHRYGYLGLRESEKRKPLS